MIIEEHLGGTIKGSHTYHYKDKNWLVYDRYRSDNFENLPLL